MQILGLILATLNKNTAEDTERVQSKIKLMETHATLRMYSRLCPLLPFVLIEFTHCFNVVLCSPKDYHRWINSQHICPQLKKLVLPEDLRDPTQINGLAYQDFVNAGTLLQPSYSSFLKISFFLSILVCLC